MYSPVPLPHDIWGVTQPKLFPETGLALLQEFFAEDLPIFSAFSEDHSLLYVLSVQSCPGRLCQVGFKLSLDTLLV